MPSAANVLLEAWSVCDTPQRKRTAGMSTDRWPGKKLLPKEPARSEKNPLFCLPFPLFLSCAASFVIKWSCVSEGVVIGEHMCYICSKMVEGLKNYNESTETC